MSKRRFHLSLGVGAILSATTLLGMAQAKDMTIGVSFDKIEPFRVAEKKALADAIAAAHAKMAFANADKDAQRQASQVDTLVSQGVNAIVAIPWDIRGSERPGSIDDRVGDSLRFAGLGTVRPEVRDLSRRRRPLR
ncbi:MAG TPA: hypothetical protein VFH59_14790 [Frateuria sp.]|uniref:hypothetical protein n=1 Tax=Frateuria sp. TaxID=2211372 RepID=UPI002D80EDBB|nr:hypothetical protein [Frateuria sp.]HET6806698.1 hypothetical protein [Frateuria sp.]